MGYCFAYAAERHGVEIHALSSGPRGRGDERRAGHVTNRGARLARGLVLVALTGLWALRRRRVRVGSAP